MTGKRVEVCSTCKRLWPRNARQCGACGASGSGVVAAAICAECARLLTHTGSEHCWGCRVDRAEEIDPHFWERDDQARHVRAHEEFLQALVEFELDLVSRGCPRDHVRSMIAEFCGRECAATHGDMFGLARTRNGQADLDPAYEGGRTVAVEADE